MLIPKYWKHIAKTVEGIDMTKCKRHWNSGNKAYISSWGYSNESEDDALSKAHERLEETIQALQNPQDDKFYYPHAVIKEDIVRTIDDHRSDGQKNGGKKSTAIITRNRYGALILNTDQLMFIDIDTPEMEKGEPSFFQKIFGKKFVWKEVSAEDKQLFVESKINEIEVFTSNHADFGCKIYKTFAGLRVIVTHKPFDADSEEVQQIFDALGADPLYQKLCQSQRCFRARLTPKRWRMKESEVLNKPELTFRITNDMIEHWESSDEKRLKQYDHWTQVYDKASDKYASCEFIEQFGSTKISEELSDLVELHDSYTNAYSTRPLA